MLLINSFRNPSFIIIRSCFTGSGPVCSCIPDSSSSNVTLSCRVAFADTSINPIPALMTWIVNGVVYTTDTPYRNKTDQYVYTVTSTIIVDASTLNSYQCILNFGQPTDIQYEFVAMNAPEWNESCSSSSEYALRKKRRNK